MTGSAELADVAELLADETVRQILLQTRAQPMAADTLSEHCDVSPSTIYRRIDRLREHDLVVEQTRPDPDGHHQTVYAATLDGVDIAVTDDGFQVELNRADPADRRAESLAGRFARLVEEM